MTKQLLTFLLIFFLLPLKAQDAFERLYRSEQNFISVDIKQTVGGDYLLLSIPLEEDFGPTKRANVTRLGPKGDLIWSKDYTFDSTTQVTGALTILPKGNFAFTTVELQPSMNKILTVANRQGNVIWSRSYGRVDTQIPGNYDKAIVLGEEDEKLKLFSTVYNTGRDEPYLAGLDSLGNIQWAQVLVNENWDAEITDVESTRDTGFIIAGILTGAINTGTLIKTDSVGNVEWSRSYQAIDSLESIFFNAVQPTPDTGYIVVGTLNNLDGPIGIEAIIAKVDSVGNLLWSVRTETGAPDSIITRINNIVENEDGSGMVVAGRTFDVENTDSYLWMMQIGSDSVDIAWQSRYSSITGQAVTQDGLAATMDGGAVFLSTRNGDGDQKAIPYLVKVDPEGSSSCQDSLGIQLAEFALFADTLVWTVQSVDTTEERMPEVESFSDFNIPVLQLDQPPPFCEGDPINVTFDATTENAVTYEWSTGEVTPSIIATEAGQYIVDVRIETDICFNLCDTVTIQEIGPPMVQLSAVGSLCASGADTLIANVSGFAESFQWSTGETGPVIFISEEGEYTVTASNFCGSTSDAIALECIFDFDACMAVPNAFTPDGDSDNDTFNALIADDCINSIRINKLKIWNRWGQVVFESDNGSAWDGTHNGKEAPSDAYLFSLEVENLEDPEIRVINGDVILIR